MARGLGHLVWLATRLLLPATAEERPEVAADAIVVLGAPLRSDGSCTTTLEERVQGAARLYARGLAPLVVMTGGVSVRARTSRPEAEGMAEAAVALGVPLGALLVERESRTTAENAAFAGVLLRERGVRRLLLLTHAYHLRRSVRLFAREGFAVAPVVLRDSVLYDGGRGSWVGAQFLARELVVNLIAPFKR